MLRKEKWHDARLRAALHSLLIMIGMGGLFALFGYFLAGVVGILFALMGAVLVFIIGSRISPEAVLRFYRARPISPFEAPDLAELTRGLAARAGLDARPALYLLPLPQPNAFTVGAGDRAAIALSRGLLERLNSRELAGVLGHEISHIRNGDIRILGMADTITRIMNGLSLIGALFFMILFPLFLLNGEGEALLLPALLMAAPSVSALLQLALSRSREFEADLNAVALTGDPAGLASALKKLEERPLNLLDLFFGAGHRGNDSSFLRTHPSTGKRVERLMALTGEQTNFRSGPIETDPFAPFRRDVDVRPIPVRVPIYIPPPSPRRYYRGVMMRNPWLKAGEI